MDLSFFGVKYLLDCPVATASHVASVGFVRWIRLSARVRFSQITHLLCAERPTLTPGRWTEEEDFLLTTAVETYGTQWFQVAKMLHGRTDDQCAKRWRENLDPSISRNPWTKEDDELLMKTYGKIGRRWKDLASHFEGRPPVHCRNRVQSLVRAKRRAIATARKAAQTKVREDPATLKEDITTELDHVTDVRRIFPTSCCPLLTFLEKNTTIPEEDPALFGWPRDAPSLTPSSYVTDLHQKILQQPHRTTFVHEYPIQEISEGFPGSPTSNQQVHPPSSYILHQGSYSQSTSTSPLDTPPHPHFVQPHIHDESSWSVPPSQLPPSTLLDSDPTSPEWDVPRSHPQPGQASSSRLLHTCGGVLISTPADHYHPRGVYWWPQDNTLTYSDRFSHRIPHSQVFGSTLQSYFTSPLAQGLSNSDFMYPPLLPGLLTTSLG